MKLKPLEGLEELRKQSARKAKFTMVNCADYFHLLARYDVEALSDSESFEAWTNYDTGRGDMRKVRSHHIRKLLETHDARGRY